MNHMLKKTSVVLVCVLFGFAIALVFPFLLTTSVSGQDEPPQLLLATPDPGINWGNAKINAPMLWALHYTGKGVRVAVVDTGIDYEHPAFQDTNFFIIRDMEKDSRDGRGITVDPANPTGLGTPVSPDDSLDYTGHGTHVAGVIAAANAASRTLGVAYDAEIVSLKVQSLTDLKETVYSGEAAPNETLSFTLELLTETAIIDAILTWEGQGNWWLRVQSPVLSFFQVDQSANNFEACTNIPIQAEREGWNVYITNMDAGSFASFTLTVRQWGWIITPEIVKNALSHAINQKANIINVSLSLGDYFDPLYEEARENNVIVVTAVGNSPPDTTPSAWNRHAIVVGATDQDDGLADFSTNGPAPDGNTKPDVVAPGVGNMAPESQHKFTPHSVFTQAFGTSIATPHVAGGAALLVQYLKETTGEIPPAPLVKTLLMGSAVTVGIGGPPAAPGELKEAKDNASGAGRIDLYRALTSFGVTGVIQASEGGPVKVDFLDCRIPIVFNNSSLDPMKATLYWDDASYEPGMRVFFSGGFTYVSDTSMSRLYYNPPRPINQLVVARPRDPRIVTDEVWNLATNYPPVLQSLDGQPYGYYFADTVWPPGVLTPYTVTVPITGNHAALRVVTYQTDPNDAAILFLSDPNGASQDTFTLSDVAVKQVVSPYEPAGGDWVLGVYNLSGKPLSATIASNYPFDLDVPHPTNLYLPLVVRQWPPVPDAPVLNPVAKADDSRDYDVTWNSAARAGSYILEEATSATFAGAIVRYNGPDTVWTVLNHDYGVFYYRVKAANVWGDSLWSAPIVVTVRPSGSILLVDDDLGKPYQTYYADALTALGRPYDTWTVSQQDGPSFATMNSYDIVIWLTGNDYSSSLTSLDQTNLAAFLNAGGKLFVSGQDIAYDTHSDSFCGSYLHAGYVSDDTNTYALTGAGIFSDISINISGTTGANNQIYPGEVSVGSGGVGIFDYDGADYGWGGVSADTGIYKVVYFAFGFEAINDSATREDVMSVVLDWFGGGGSPPPPVPCGYNFLLNSDFEEDTPPGAFWQESTNVPHTIISKDFPYSGERSIFMGSYNNAEEWVRQSFIVPSGLDVARLSFWWHGESIATGDSPSATLKIGLQSPPGNYLGGPRMTISDADIGSGWVWTEIPVSGFIPWAGQTLWLSFEATTNSSAKTRFAVDDMVMRFDCSNAVVNDGDGVPPIIRLPPPAP